jgi:hypothetical protein
MEIKKTPVVFEEEFISVDGKSFQFQDTCEQYEQLLLDSTPLRNLSFFDKAGEPLDIFALHDIPPFSYLVLKHDIPDFDPEAVQAIIGADDTLDFISFSLPHTVGIWYNDWTNSYSGGYGRNGWRRCPSIEELQATISSCQNQIALLNKLNNDIKKD